MGTLATMKLSEGAVDFIDDARLEGLLAGARPDDRQVDDVIAKSLAKSALTVEETALLLKADRPEQVERIFEAARELKRAVYGNRIVLFAPLYVGNQCVNDCRYCGFRRSNRGAGPPHARRRGVAPAGRGARARGHKRLILVFGEHPKYDADFIARRRPDGLRDARGATAKSAA